MTNKRQTQIENKRRHRSQLKSKRGTEPQLSRAIPSKFEKPRILIVCEGKNTEKSYFDKFRLTSADLVTLGKGYNTTSLVKAAVKLSKADNYQQIWCVFDKDDFKLNDFNRAIVMAESKGFNVAYSNQAFEYWLILHFDDHQGSSMHRDDYNDKINGYINSLGAEYDGKGTKIVTDELFDLLEAVVPGTNRTRRDIAITRAKRNYNRFDHSSPATEESSTKVFMLVEEIVKYL